MQSEKKKVLLCLLSYLVMVAAKALTLILPSKYFYDNTRIVSMVNQDGFIPSWEGSYQTTADIFRTLNVFGFNTMTEWSFFLGIIFTTAVCALIFTNNTLDIYQEFLWLCSIGLLNIYVFNIGKDIIQFTFFYLVFIIAISGKTPRVLRIALIALLFYFESIYFRSYFILVAVFFICLSMLNLYLASRQVARSIGRYLICVLVIVYGFLIVSSIFLPEQYQQVADVRSGINDNREGAADAATLISNLIPGKSLLVALLNYPINAVRMLCPIELALRSPAYLPFVIFQLMCLMYLLIISKKIIQAEITDTRMVLVFSVYWAFLLTSFFFEPDFGSWVRHEMAAFPIFQYLFFNQYCSISKNTNGCITMRRVA